MDGTHFGPAGTVRAKIYGKDPTKA